MKMDNVYKSRNQLVKNMQAIEEFGRFLGISPSPTKIIKVYSIDGKFAELHFQKNLGLILDIKYVDKVKNLIELSR